MPFRLIVAIALLLAAYVDLQRPAVAGDTIAVQAVLVSVEPGPGCGVLVVGSPATYRVTSGPSDLRGQQIHVLIACIEMAGLDRNVREFVVGSTHQLILTRENAHHIEVPSVLPEGAWFYVKSASLRRGSASGGSSAMSALGR